jgi:alanine-glyoxylate transaminase/serine-glyoxylate transaminase/serine-pyruvate transaminase
MPTIDHRSPVRRHPAPARDGVRKVSEDRHRPRCSSSPATGTGGWEAAITNTLSPGDTVLAARNGMFSHRWIDMCQRHGLDVEIVDCALGRGRARRPLRRRSLKATPATDQGGAGHPQRNRDRRPSDIAAVRAAMDAPTPRAAVRRWRLLHRLDGLPRWTTGASTSPSPAAQKGFMLPAGMAIVGFSPKALAAMETGECRAPSSTSATWRRANAKRLSLHARRRQLMNGLREACDMLLDEGLDNVFARHARIAEGVRAPCAPGA